MKKLHWFGYGALFGLTSLTVALASVPSRNHVTDDTAIYQNLSDIRVARQGKLDFDADIKRLSQLEPGYREKLPALRGPMQRISQQKYQASRTAAKPVSW